MLLFLLLLRQLLPPAMGCSALMLPPRLLPPECAALIAAAPAGVSANMLARFPMLVEQRGGVSAACFRPAALSTPASTATAGR